MSEEKYNAFAFQVKNIYVCVYMYVYKRTTAS